MKGYWLFLAGLYLSFFYLPFKMRILLSIIMCIYLLKRNHNLSIIFIITTVILLSINHNYPLQAIPSKQVKIIDIRANYVIASDAKNKVILYGLDHVSFDDELLLSGKYQLISSLENPPLFSFRKYCEQKNIYYAMNVEKYQILHKGNSIQSKIYQYVDNHNLDLVKMMFYQIQDDSHSDIIISTGLYFSFIISYLRKKWHHQAQRLSIIIIIITLIFGYCFRFSTILLRILFHELIITCCKNSSKHDRLGIEMLLMLIIRKDAAYEMAFLLPMSLRFFASFKSKCPKWIKTMLIIAFYQLIYYQSLSIISLLSFPLQRIISIVLFFIALLSFILPQTLISLSMDLLFKLMAILQSDLMMINGNVSIIWIITFIIIYAYLIQNNHKSDYVKICFLLIWLIIKPYCNPFARIIMLDVGQGDCTIVITPFRKEVIMVDIMGSKYKNIPKDVVVPYLKSQGINRIDTLIITHDDFDHSGGKEQLMELMEVNQVIDSKKQAKQFDYPFWKFLMNDTSGKDLNDQSIISYFQLYNTNVLLMGDLSSKFENQLLAKYNKLDVDILKLSHHGSETSSSLVFLHKLHPDLALISAGRNNRYHHPSKRVIDSLNQERINYLQTSRDGIVDIKIWNNLIFIMTSEKTFVIINNK